MFKIRKTDNEISLLDRTYFQGRMIMFSVMHEMMK